MIQNEVLSATQCDIKWIPDNVDAFDRGLGRRGMPEPDGKALTASSPSTSAARAAIAKLEQAQARRNAASKEIGRPRPRRTRRAPRP